MSSSDSAEKVRRLFQFIRDLSESDKMTLINLRDQQWYKFLSDIDDNLPGVKKYGMENNDKNLLI